MVRGVPTHLTVKIICGHTTMYSYVYLDIFVLKIQNPIAYGSTRASPNSESYWGSDFKNGKRCLCTFWGLGVGAAAGAAAKCSGHVCFGAWVLVPLQGAAAVGAAAGCRCCGGAHKNLWLSGVYAGVIFGGDWIKIGYYIGTRSY